MILVSFFFFLVYLLIDDFTYIYLILLRELLFCCKIFKYKKSWWNVLFFFFLLFDIDNIPDIFHIRRWGTVRPDNCVSRCLCYCKNLSYFWLSFLYIWQLHDFTWYCELKKLKLNIFFSLPYIDINTNTFLSKSQYLSFL